MIKLENVHKSFGKNEVLKGINLHIKQGQVVVSSALLVLVKVRYCAL